jgi:hypothetical protein
MLDITKESIITEEVSVDYFGEIIEMIGKTKHPDWTIDRTNVIEDMLDMPRVIQKWGAISAHADYAYSLAKHSLEIVEKSLFSIVEQDFKDKGKKVLKKSIEGAVLESEEYQDALIEKYRAERRAALAKACLSAVYNKRDVLKELATRERYENSVQ